MSTQNDGQTVVDSGRCCASNIVPTPIQFSLVNTPLYAEFSRKRKNRKQS